jgi:hypothetical protein
MTASWCTRETRPSAVASDREEHSRAARHCSSSQTEPNHVLERFPRIPYEYERARGCDFFTMEVLSWRGLMTYYVLFFLHLESRRVHIAGITRHPDKSGWSRSDAPLRKESWGCLHPCRYVLHDRDTKFCASFRSALASGGVKTIPLTVKSPNLNGFAERWVRSVKQDCLSKLILCGEGRLSQVLTEKSHHYPMKETIRRKPIGCSSLM